MPASAPHKKTAMSLVWAPVGSAASLDCKYCLKKIYGYSVQSYSITPALLRGLCLPGVQGSSLQTGLGLCLVFDTINP